MEVIVEGLFWVVQALLLCPVDLLANGQFLRPRQAETGHLQAIPVLLRGDTGVCDTPC